MRLCVWEGGGGEIVKGKAQLPRLHTHTHTPSCNQGGISLPSPDLLATLHDCALLQASAEYSPRCLSGRHQRDTAGQFEVCPVWREVHVGCVWGEGSIVILLSHLLTQCMQTTSIPPLSPSLILHSLPPLDPNPPSSFPHTLLVLPYSPPLPALPASLLYP